MNINLINDDTYEVLDDDGVQIEQGSVTQDMRDRARAKKWSVRRLIAEDKKVRIDRPVLVAVGSEEVAIVPDHDHEFDDRYAPAEHEHDLPSHEHPHSHDEFMVLKQAIEEESRNRYSADDGLKHAFDEHKHPEYAQTFHAHDDVYASLNVLRGMVTAVEARIPTEMQPHQHNDVIEALNLLRSEVHGIRQELNSLGNRIDAEALTTRSLIAQASEDLQPKGDYLTRDEINPLTQSKRVYRVKVRSRQNVDGDEHMTLEDV